MANKVGQILGMMDFGETFYMVDSDYRTAAQGWSAADGTAPLDLWGARNKGRVFYTPGGAIATAGSSDASAMQYAIDQMTDFRGDILYFLPGTYTPATALVLDVSESRWMGSRRKRGQSASIVAGVAAALAPTTAGDSMEFAYLRLVPLTAGIMFSRPAAVDNWWMHDFTYDARGITASTSTIFVKDTGACLNTMFEDFLYLSNTAIGPFYQIAGASISGCIQNFLHIHTANTLVTSLFETISGGAGATGFTIGPGHVQIGGGGVITQLGAMIDMTANGTNATLRNITTSVAGATNTLGWESATGVGPEGDIVNCWIATVGGGAGRAALIGAA